MIHEMQSMIQDEIHDPQVQRSRRSGDEIQANVRCLRWNSSTWPIFEGEWLSNDVWDDNQQAKRLWNRSGDGINDRKGFNSILQVGLLGSLDYDRYSRDSTDRGWCPFFNMRCPFFNKLLTLWNKPCDGFSILLFEGDEVEFNDRKWWISTSKTRSLDYDLQQHGIGGHLTRFNMADQAVEWRS